MDERVGGLEPIAKYGPDSVSSAVDVLCPLRVDDDLVLYDLGRLVRNLRWAVQRADARRPLRSGRPSHGMAVQSGRRGLMTCDLLRQRAAVLAMPYGAGLNPGAGIGCHAEPMSRSGGSPMSTNRPLRFRESEVPIRRVALPTGWGSSDCVTLRFGDRLLTNDQRLDHRF
jgi:hypothetical protein